MDKKYLLIIIILIITFTLISCHHISDLNSKHIDIMLVLEDKIDELVKENEELKEKLASSNIIIDNTNPKKYLGEFETTAYTDDIQSQGIYLEI